MNFLKNIYAHSAETAKTLHSARQPLKNENENPNENKQNESDKAANT